MDCHDKEDVVLGEGGLEVNKKLRPDNSLANISCVLLSGGPADLLRHSVLDGHDDLEDNFIGGSLATLPIPPSRTETAWCTPSVTPPSKDTFSISSGWRQKKNLSNDQDEALGYRKNSSYHIGNIVELLWQQTHNYSPLHLLISNCDSAAHMDSVRCIPGAIEVRQETVASSIKIKMDDDNDDDAALAANFDNCKTPSQPLGSEYKARQRKGPLCSWTWKNPFKAPRLLPESP